MISALILIAVVETSSFKNVDVARSYDGDTIFVNLPGVPPIFGHEMGVRIQGIDSPEIHGKRKCEKDDAQVAKANMEDLMALGKVDLLFCEKDKFFRLLCTVRIADKYDAATQMIDSGLARPYFGEKKTAWKCHKKDSK